LTFQKFSATSFYGIIYTAAKDIVSPQSNIPLMCCRVSTQTLKEIDTMSNYITYEERMEVENCLSTENLLARSQKNSEKTVLLFPEKSENTLLLNAPVMEQTVTMLVCIGTVAPKFTYAAGVVPVNR